MTMAPSIKNEQQTIIPSVRRHLPLRSQLLPALRVPDGRIVRREVGVRELQLPAVGTRTAAAPLGLDVLEALASVGLHLFAAQEDLAFESLAQELDFWGGRAVVLFRLAVEAMARGSVVRPFGHEIHYHLSRKRSMRDLDLKHEDSDTCFQAE